MDMLEFIKKVSSLAGLPEAKTSEELQARVEIFVRGYQLALSDLAHEFESHDYFGEAGKVRCFAKTSVFQSGVSK